MKHKNLKIAIAITCMVIMINILTSCKESTQRNVNTDLLVFKRDQIKEIDRISFDDAEFIDSCVFVLLETTELSLIGDITSLETFEGKFYIFDRQTKKLKVFSSTGDFLYDIGRKGNGPGEYLGIHLFIINSKERKICLFDPLKLAVHEYSLDGKFLQSKEHYQVYYAHMQKAVYAGDVIYCYSSIHWSENWTYTVISSKDYSIKEQFCPYPVHPIEQVGFSPMDHPFSYINGEFHYTSLFSDTIYKYENGIEIPYLLIETGKPNIPLSYLKNRELADDPYKAYTEILNDSKYSEGFTDIGETDRFVLANFKMNPFFYLLDKKENTGYYVKSFFPPDLGMPKLIDGNKLIKIWDQDAIMGFQREIERGKKCPDAIATLIEGYDPSYHNPVLVVYYMKQ